MAAARGRAPAAIAAPCAPRAGRPAGPSAGRRARRRPTRRSGCGRRRGGACRAAAPARARTGRARSSARAADDRVRPALLAHRRVVHQRVGCDGRRRAELAERAHAPQIADVQRRLVWAPPRRPWARGAAATADDARPPSRAVTTTCAPDSASPRANYTRGPRFAPVTTAQRHGAGCATMAGNLARDRTSDHPAARPHSAPTPARASRPPPSPPWRGRRWRARRPCSRGTWSPRAATGAPP